MIDTSFLQYFFKESPDSVYADEHRELRWNDKDQLAFGYIKVPAGLGGTVFLMSELTHLDIAEEFYSILATAANYKNRPYNPKTDINPQLGWKKIVSGVRKLTAPVRYELASGKFYKKLLDARRVNSRQKAVRNEINYRTALYTISGRAWTQSKVISFWNVIQDVSPQILDQTFDNLGISDRQAYKIDVINPRKLSIEETNQKILPTYDEYKAKWNKPTSKDGTKLTKIGKESLQQFMAKQHGMAGAQKAKFSTYDSIPDVGSKKYRRVNLADRQKAMTSESLLTESPDEVWDPRTKKMLEWSDKNNWTFGQLAILPGIQPFYIACEGQTHADLIEVFFSEITYMFENTRELSEASALQIFKTVAKNPTALIQRLIKEYKKHYKLVVENAHKNLELIFKNPALMNNIVRKGFHDKLYANIEKMIKTNAPGESSAARELVRERILIKSGRAWLSQKVISFWATKSNISLSDLQRALAVLGVKQNQQDLYLVDVIDPNNLSIESTSKKQLIPFKDYHQKANFKNERRAKSAPALSKKEIKELEDFKRKKHITPGAIHSDPSIKNASVGARRYASLKPLDLRQKVQTSESYVI